MTFKEKKPLEKFYELYEEGRKEKAPQSYIDYFKASKFLLDALDEQRAEILACLPEEKDYISHMKSKKAFDEGNAWNSCRSQFLKNLSDKE